MAWEEESVRECSGLLNNVILLDTVKDSWRWLLDPIHGYSIRGTYRFLTSDNEPTATGATNNVWDKLVPSKVSLFAWRLLQDRIPIKSNLVRCRILQPANNFCVGGCDNIETTFQLFIGCDVFGSVWYLVCHWLGISVVFSGSITDYFL